MFEEGGSEFDGAFARKEAPRAGRRRRPAADEEEAPPAAAGAGTGAGAGAEPAAASPAAGPPKKSGWGDDIGLAAGGESAAEGPTPSVAARPGRRKAGATESVLASASEFAAQADEKPAPSRNRHNIDDEGGDIPVIPDLEEEVEEDITRQVAAAPRVRNNRVQALKELDQEIKFSLPTTGDANIDLSILTSTLSPQDQVVEDEGPWEFDVLLSEVAQELQAEEDKKEEGDTEPDAKDKAPVAAAAS